MLRPLLFPPRLLCHRSLLLRRANSNKSLYPLPSWANKIPIRARWIHPYLSLARLDKPIGTWLLFWPCGKKYSQFLEFNYIN